LEKSPLKYVAVFLDFPETYNVVGFRITVLVCAPVQSGKSLRMVCTHHYSTSIAERYIGDSLEIKAATVNRMHGEKKTGRDIESQL
jgi:hypothetical protein